MMIASWMDDSVSSQVISPRLFISPDFEFAGGTPACDAKKRDREVPYGMKGGEH
jgi:hypothetical protein